MNSNVPKIGVGGWLAVIGISVIAFLPLIVLGFLYSGWAVAVCWNLVVVKIFATAPHLTWAMGIGLATVIAVLRGSNNANYIKPEYLVELNYRNTISLVSPLVCVFICWVVAHFIH